MKNLLLLCCFITQVSAGFFARRLCVVSAFMNRAGINQHIEKNLTRIINIENHRPTDLAMLTMLAGIEKPYRKGFRHYFGADGTIVEHGLNSTKPEHETIWELLDKYKVPYNNDKIEHCGQSLGTVIGKDLFNRVNERIFKVPSGTSFPIVHNIFILKNQEDPNAPPKCVSANESCEPMLRIFERFFPDVYSKLKGCTIYHSNNFGPITGRSGDFAVFAALWNAIHKEPAKQVIFTGRIADDGSLYPIGALEKKNKCAQALKMPIVVQTENFAQLKGIEALYAAQSEALTNIELAKKLGLNKELDNLIGNVLSQYNLNKDVLLVESLPDLITFMYNQPNLDKAALDKINTYKPIVERHRRILQALIASCGIAGGVFTYSNITN